MRRIFQEHSFDGVINTHSTITSDLSAQIISIWDNAAQAEIKNPKFKKNKVVNYLDATNNLKHLLGVTETKKEKK